MIEKNNEIMKIDEINLMDLVLGIWNQKKIIFCFIFIASIISIIYALKLPNVYTSTALLAPAQNEQSSDSPLNRYSNIIRLGGLILPSSSAGSQQEAIATLKSFQFFEDIFLPNIALDDLMSVKSWDQSKNEVKYNKRVILKEESAAIAADENLEFVSAQEAFQVFRRSFTVTRDKDNGFITLSLSHKSPFIAEKWLRIIISSINKEFSDNQKLRSEISISYLNEKIIETNLSEIRQGLSKLMEQEVEKLMLIESNKDYIFKVIDSPIAPELKSKPQRSIICIVGAIIGGFFGLIIGIIREFKFL